MKSSPLKNKTIRPGSLNGYSYYHSGRPAPMASKPTKSRRRLPSFKLLAIPLVLIAIIVVPLLLNKPSPDNSTKKSAATVVKAPPINRCRDNSLDKLIKISIDQRHLWACQANKQVYDAPIITGLKDHPETETPLGTYKIYGKQKNTTLKGTDSRGTWSDPVYYWMPFLDNQYGTYGFHDATWRPETAFGNIDPSSKDASHGCVELPLAASKWLYDWAPVRTTVTVES